MKVTTQSPEDARYQKLRESVRTSPLDAEAREILDRFAALGFEHDRGNDWLRRKLADGRTVVVSDEDWDLLPRRFDASVLVAVYEAEGRFEDEFPIGSVTEALEQLPRLIEAAADGEED